MSFSEDLLKLRQKFQEAANKGIISADNKDIFEATLVQIINDAEKHRQNYINQAESLRRQASVFDGQASAFASFSGIIYNVLNGFILLSDKTKEENNFLDRQEIIEK